MKQKLEKAFNDARETTTRINLERDIALQFLPTKKYLSQARANKSTPLFLLHVPPLLVFLTDLQKLLTALPSYIIQPLSQ